jgi:hypothetical protein
MSEIADYVKRRNRVLRELDLSGFYELLTENGATHLPIPQVAFASMHKARMAVTSFSEEEKAISRQWLTDNGFQPKFLGVDP